MSWFDRLSKLLRNDDPIQPAALPRHSRNEVQIAAQIHGQKMSPEESGRIMELDAANDLRIIRELAPILRGMIYGPETSPEISEEQIRELIAPSWEKTQSLI